jgi:geranylgeranyl diphosphate synthase, type II
MTAPTIEQELHELSKRVERALDRWLPSAEIHPRTLHSAMRYSVFNGGKRVRPVLVYATGKALGVPPEALDGPACAVELVHDYSLIHDDLPAMDNDDLRRGKPTCHKAFGEATAILAGDALQALAFEVLAADPDMIADAAVRLRMTQQLATAAGSRGMAGGQMIDLEAVGQTLQLAALEDMHIHKTGALIRAAVMMGAISKVDVSDPDLHRLDRFAKCLGLAFQIRDDILDEEGETSTIGKTQGADKARNKPTYPALLGLRESKAHAKALCDEALASLENYDQRADLLRSVARYIVERIN